MYRSTFFFRLIAWQHVWVEVQDSWLRFLTYLTIPCKVYGQFYIHFLETSLRSSQQICGKLQPSQCVYSLVYVCIHICMDGVEEVTASTLRNYSGLSLNTIERFSHVWSLVNLDNVGSLNAIPYMFDLCDFSILPSHSLATLSGWHL